MFVLLGRSDMQGWCSREYNCWMAHRQKFGEVVIIEMDLEWKIWMATSTTSTRRNLILNEVRAARIDLIQRLEHN